MRRGRPCTSATRTWFLPTTSPRRGWGRAHSRPPCRPCMRRCARLGRGLGQGAVQAVHAQVRRGAHSMVV